jgi:putative membrane protein
MLNLFITWFFSAAILFMSSRLVEGFIIPNIETALMASFVIGLLNVFIRPFITLISLPVNILTLGLFSFVINAMILKMADAFMEGILIETWGVAFMASVFLALIQVAANIVLPGRWKFLGRS